ncbi:MAG TPA: biotin synthase BioB [Candidatus Nanoarchaeia archaeon]|nr:biotin synthase BioB [Candidatus Nanoarchaeia archaeon]
MSKNNWTAKEIIEIHNSPLLELVYRAATVHRKHNDPSEVQVSSLLSIKTGACSEDCSYCPQSARYHTGLKVEPLLNVDEVVDSAKKAKQGGATRFCMGAAWREVKDNKDFDKVLEMVKSVNSMGMEVCCTLGMITESQAKKLREAGLYAYNHNIDSSEDFYKKIITTRKFEDRLKTLENVRKAGITVCCGGIIGMGESVEDRAKMLVTLSSMDPQPESVPINALVPIKGTPLGTKGLVSVWEMIRMVATARIVLPNSVVRLSAGRMQMSKEAQALCFLAGANSIFAGDKLLTTPNPEFNEDMEMFKIFGLKPREAFKKLEKRILN